MKTIKKGDGYIIEKEGENLFFTFDEIGETVESPEGIFLLVKSGDSYYRNSIPSIHFNGMHDTRGLIDAFQDEKKALNKLRSICEQCDTFYISESEKNDVESYQGPGYYRNGWPILLDDERFFEDDLRYFSVTSLLNECEWIDDAGSIYELLSNIEHELYGVLKFDFIEDVQAD